MRNELVLPRLGRIVRLFGPWAGFCTGFCIFYWVIPTETTRRHELAHMRQAKQLGLLRWYWRYLLELARHGYRNNVFEKSARHEAGEE